MKRGAKQKIDIGLIDRIMERAIITDFERETWKSIKQYINDLERMI
jgi:hypothetical protein